MNNLNLEQYQRKNIFEITTEDLTLSVDWVKVEQILSQLRKTSEGYLKDILNLKPKYKTPYVNWYLSGIRARFEKSYKYRKKAQISLEYKFGLRHKILRMIIKCLVDRKKYLKLKRNHNLFFQDSKSQFIQFLGRFYN